MKNLNYYECNLRYESKFRYDEFIHTTSACSTTVMFEWGYRYAKCELVFNYQINGLRNKRKRFIRYSYKKHQ